ncbi:hypothetical protein PoB_000796800 [Plakobranchus ocellatus]|uniref:Uncharacterized protein n=1 Tax=Plakobranchus ocellatus TaxID=259542 RepID=A0AAV3YGE1_9GAST|nr:hypothetical protein PoB_000796800 [Plakobranchus ocellatus]
MWRQLRLLILCKINCSNPTISPLTPHDNALTGQGWAFDEGAPLLQELRAGFKAQKLGSKTTTRFTVYCYLRWGGTISDQHNTIQCHCYPRWDGTISEQHNTILHCYPR